MSGNDERSRIRDFPKETKFVFRRPRDVFDVALIIFWIANISFYVINFSYYSLWIIPLCGLAAFFIGLATVERQMRGPSRGLEPEDWMSANEYRRAEIDRMFEPILGHEYIQQLREWGEELEENRRNDPVEQARIEYLENLARAKTCPICQTIVEHEDLDEKWHVAHGVCVECYFGRSEVRDIRRGL